MCESLERVKDVQWQEGAQVGDLSPLAPALTWM